MYNIHLLVSADVVRLCPGDGSEDLVDIRFFELVSE